MKKIFKVILITPLLGIIFILIGCDYYELDSKPPYISNVEIEHIDIGWGRYEAEIRAQDDDLDMEILRYKIYYPPDLLYNEREHLILPYQTNENMFYKLIVDTGYGPRRFELRIEDSAGNTSNDYIVDVQ